MNPLILALSTALSLGVDLYRSSANTEPAQAQPAQQFQNGTDDAYPRAHGSHVRGPSSDETALRPYEVGRTEVFDPCYGKSPVHGVVSEQDGSSHTCYCTAVTGLQGRVERYDVACF